MIIWLVWYAVCLGVGYLFDSVFPTEKYDIPERFDVSVGLLRTQTAVDNLGASGLVTAKVLAGDSLSALAKMRQLDGELSHVQRANHIAGCSGETQRGHQRAKIPVGDVQLRRTIDDDNRVVLAVLAGVNRD